jgi:SpoVK/Ycf46/Vps4 family AAA+-type ATPase
MKYFLEISKIIEGGIRGDMDKVKDYSALLSEKLKKDGDLRKSEKIEKIITIQGGGESFNGISVSRHLPYDSESKLELAEILHPNQIIEKKLIFNKEINKQIDEFIDSYVERDNLMVLGLDMPSTLLLYGPPGCGKTEISLLTARKLGLPIVIARLDTLISSYLGSTSKNIRMLFEYASKNPCILFLDEFDAIGKLRDDKNEMGELKRVVNSLLQNIDFLNNKSILIAATNHENLLDVAIWRRFNTRVHIDYPNREIRFEIINQVFNEVNYEMNSGDIFVQFLVNLLEKQSVADIQQILKRAFRKAILQKRNIEYYDFIDCYFEYVPNNIYADGDQDTVRREKLKFLISKQSNMSVSNRLWGQIMNCHHNTIVSDLKKIK